MFQTNFRQKAYREVSVPDAKKLLDENKDILLLDVRSPEEYAEIHIPASTLLPLNQVENGISKYAPNKDKPILVYCLSGARADSACKTLAALGYTNVATMGGIRSWKYGLEGSRA